MEPFFFYGSYGLDLKCAVFPNPGDLLGTQKKIISCLENNLERLEVKKFTQLTCFLKGFEGSGSSGTLLTKSELSDFKSL